MAEYRARALAGAPLPTKQVNGAITDNWVESPGQGARLRRSMGQHSELLFDKPLSEDFTLVVKHPAELTGLATLLVDHFPLYAIVRDPLAVLAAWQTVDMPVNRGRMPMLECFAPHIKRRLDAAEDTLARQVELLRFQFQTYLSLGHERILRYEELVANPQKALAPICPVVNALPPRSAHNPLRRYPGLDFSALAARLVPILPLIEEVYPAFSLRWHAYLPKRTMVAVDRCIVLAMAPKQRTSAPAETPRIFVMGAYLRAGGAHMAHEIGRVVQEALGGGACYAVTCDGESPEASVFDYTQRFDAVPRASLPNMVRPNDILICNPSHSDGLVGLTHSCRKLTYVQGFNTFSVLDRWFDRYVAVSGFVQEFLASVYGLEAPVISPFVSVPSVEPPAWWNRRANSVVFYLKGNRATQLALLDRLRKEVGRLDPTAEAAIDWAGSILWAGERHQTELLGLIARHRHLVALSPCEGFGLVPLEAMALGATVLGFEGFGGRDYMRPGINCLTRAFPNLEGIAQDLVDCLRGPERAAEIAAQGPASAARYSRHRFDEAWRRQLDAWL